MGTREWEEHVAKVQAYEAVLAAEVRLAREQEGRTFAIYMQACNAWMKARMELEQALNAPRYHEAQAEGAALVDVACEPAMEELTQAGDVRCACIKVPGFPQALASGESTMQIGTFDYERGEGS